MISLGDAILKITGDDSQLKNVLQGLHSQIANNFSEMSARLGESFASVGEKITGMFEGMLEESMGSEKASAQLAAVLKSTGEAAGMTEEACNDLATALSKVSTYDDDTIKSGESLLLTFTSIGKDVFPKATETMLDMSTALGTDLKGSAIQLGKALNDPMNGISALSRVGVSFTEEQKQSIATFMSQNNIIGAQKIILAELAKEFGGSAAAQAKTLSGQFQLLKNDFANLLEAFGNALTSGKGLPGLIDKMRSAIAAVQAWVEKNPALASSLLKIVGVLGVLATVFGTVFTALSPLIAAFGLMGGAGGVLPLCVAGFAAMTGPIGLIIGAVAVLGPLLIGLIGKLMGVTAAQKQQEESQKRVNEKTNEYISLLEKKGIAVDKDAMKNMDDAQKAQYLSQRVIEAKEKEVSSIISQITKQDATREQIFKAELARTALDLTAKEAAALSLRNISNEQIKDMKNYTEAQKTEIKKQLDAQIASYETYNGKLSEQTHLSDKETREIRKNLERLSLDTRQSPSVNDLAKEGFSNYYSLLDESMINSENRISSFRNFANDIFSSIGNMAANAWNSLKNFFNGGNPTIPQNAYGTRNFQGGLTMVGEKGREIVNLPKGSQIYSNNDTERMLSGNNGSSNLSISAPITINGYNGNPDELANKISAQIKREFMRGMQRAGSMI